MGDFVKLKHKLVQSQSVAKTGLLRFALWIRSSLTFKIIVLFVGTFVLMGGAVYFFEHHYGNKEQYTNIWDGLWWGVVTITTTGYGDKYPVSAPGRIFAALTMCTGIITAGIVTGNIASWLVESRLKAGRGILNLAGKSKHLVICGWSKQMATVVEELLTIDSSLKPADIVILAPISQETMEAFKTDERFSEVNIVRGDYFNHTMLQHASVKLANRVLILSDSSSPTQSINSVDAKTVMAAMTIRKIAPDVYIHAEIIDRKFEHYLKLAQCDEIILSREYSRDLLASSARNRGMAHVMYALLNVKTPVGMVTVPIPSKLIGKNFKELSDYFLTTYGVISVGVIENTGNLNKMKMAAVAEAQKNPDTRSILRNIKEIKRLRPNTPVINPKRDYIVKKHSRAVLVGDRLRCALINSEVAA